MEVRAGGREVGVGRREILSSGALRYRKSLCRLVGCSGWWKARWRPERGLWESEHRGVPGAARVQRLASPAPVPKRLLTLLLPLN